MTSLTLVRRSFRYYGRSHLGALLGAALGTAVLVGALAVGDSVRGSLRDMALARLGAIDYALMGNDRFFRAALADDMTKSSGVSLAPAVQVQGIGTRTDGSARANAVQVLGVDERFWKLGLQPATFQPPGPDE